MRRLSFFMAASLVAVVLIAPRAMAGQKTVVLKLAHQWPQNPKDYVVGTAIKFAQQIERRTNGRIMIKFYPAESLVKTADMHTALRNGTVDMAIYPYIDAAGVIPQLNLMLLPGLWKNHDEVFAFRKTAVWQRLEQRVERYGFKTLCWIQVAGGVASKDKPVLAPSDVKGMKVNATGKYMEYALEKLGASPALLSPSEVYIGMRSGIMGAMWAWSTSFPALHLYKAADYYVSPEKYAYLFTIEPITISMHTWMKLTPADRQIMLDVGRGLERSALNGAKREDSAIAKKFAASGTRVEQLSEAQWNLWEAAFRKYAFPRFVKEVPNGKWLLETSLKFYKR